VEGASSLETVVHIHGTTRRYIVADTNLNSHCHGKFISQKISRLMVCRA